MRNTCVYLQLAFILIQSFDCLLISNEFCSIPDKLINQAVCKEFSCGNKFCSLVKRECEPLNLMSYLKDISARGYKKAVYDHKRLVKNIQECSPGRYVLIKDRVCLNKKVCFEKMRIAVGFTYNKVAVMMPRPCGCKGKFGYNCRKGYCAANNQTCQKIFDIKPSAFSNITVCG